ncbi:MAG: sulfurase [Pseudomonadota bacterium]
MAILKKTALTGTVAWLGTVADSDASIAAESTDKVEVTWDGFTGDCHSRINRPSCVRVRAIYPKEGTEIRNTRQLSILSTEDLAEVSTRLDIPEVKPEWVGASMVVSGIPEFTLIPPSARLVFGNGTVLVADMENAPCRYPADLIEAAHPGHGKAFPKVAVNKRGITAWVEHPGSIALGDTFQLFIPPQRIYAHG